jgi:small-conductance mechanosensitive channel
VEFADSAIQLELGFWIEDPAQGTLQLRSQINLGVLRRFRDEGIDIPFPQREVTIRGAADPDVGALRRPGLEPTQP